MLLAPLTAAWLLAACSGDEGDVPKPVPSPSPSVATGDTAGATHMPTGPQVVCTSTNAFRLSCEVIGAPLQATLSLSLPGDAAFLRTGQAAAPLLWTGLTPSTTYEWVLSSEETLLQGTASTMALPNAVQIETTVTGSLGVPFVGMLSPCGADEVVLVVDEAGEVVWYESMSKHAPGLLEGVSFTEDDTVLGVVGFPPALVEVNQDGQALWLLEEPPLPVHHDAFRKDGRTYVLVQEALPLVLLDGFDVYDTAGEVVWEWRLSDVLTPVPHPDSGRIEADYSHANSVWVDDAGDVYLSLRHLSTVLKIAGLERPQPGEVLWTLVGDPDEQRIVGDIALLGGESFVQQHNVHRMPDGRMALLDNRSLVVEMSRLLWLSIDEDAGTAKVSEAWTLPSHCPFQGGAWTTSNGLALATCAPRQQGYAFAPGVEMPVWSMQATCAGSGGQRFVPRMVPLDAF